MTLECNSQVPAPATLSATDNCDANVTVTYNQTQQGTGCPYTLTRTWTATDDCGNSITHTQIITVSDTQNPTWASALPQNMTLQCSSQVPAPATLTATDNCDANVTVTYNQTQQGTGCPYTLTRTWTATDDCGNSVTHTQLIMVDDNTPPVFVEPADLTVSCGNLPAPVAPAVSDNCDTSLTVNYLQLVSNLACGQEVKRIWTATDDCGNVAVTEQIITVTDDMAPQVVFTHPLLAGLTDGDTLYLECDEAVVFGANDAMALDSCSDATISFDEGAFTLGDCPTDNYIVWMQCTWTATDACGNSSDATLNIVIVDNDAPVFTSVPADVTIQCGDPVPPCGNAFAVDDCSDVSMSVSTDSIPTAEGYDLVCTWTATDDCGNSEQAIRTIHVLDTATPVISNVPLDTIIYLGQGEVTPTPALVFAIDACTNDTIPIVFAEIKVVDGCDTILTRIWTATDPFGNTATAEQTIVLVGKIEANVAMTSPQNCNGNFGSATLTPNTFTYNWSDGGTGAVRNDLVAGSYTVTATDGHCYDTLTLNIGFECPCDMPVLDTLLITNATCGDTTGAAVLELTGDEADYHFLWIPNFGTPNANGNGRTGLPAGHYIVIVNYLDQTDCVEKFNIDIFDDCPRCAPVFEEAEVTLHVPSAPDKVCLPVPYGVSQQHTIYVDGVTYAGALSACDDEPMAAYSWSLLAGVLQNGGLLDASWAHNGMTFNTLVYTMDELAAAMTAADPTGGWYNDANTYRLISTGTGGTYGALTITHVPSQFSAQLQPSVYQTASGTRLLLNQGTHLIVYVDPTTDCADTLLVHVEVPDLHPDVIFAEKFLAVSENCDYRSLDVCLEIPFAKVNEYSFSVNGQPYNGAFSACDYFADYSYSYVALMGMGATGPYQLKGWSFNGKTYTAGFSDFTDLAAKLNQWDPNGQWKNDPLTFSITGGSSTGKYGAMTIEHTASGAVAVLQLNSHVIPGNARMTLPEGWNTVIATRLADGKQDTLTALAACLTPDVFNTTMKISEQDTLCLSLDELPGSVATVFNNCEAQAGEAVQFDVMPGKNCIRCVAKELGFGAACMVICDEYGICDTTYLNVTVREDEVTHLQPDTLYTVVNQPVTSDLLANDVFAKGIASVNIRQKAKHGTLEISPDFYVTYAPLENYCNTDREPDRFTYEVCLTDGTCYEMMAFVEVACDELIIFNAFSPNGDGKNDFFRIAGLEKYPNHQLSIYNRWGNLVFKTKDYRNDWGGAWRSNHLPDGTYFYLLDDGEGKKYTGYLQVRR
jgi:gliding motility-associated-like protein